MEEVVRASLERIERLDPQLNAVVALRAEGAIAEARAADRASETGAVERRSGERSAERRSETGAADSVAAPLRGIPFAIKDVTETLELPTTYGSVAFAGHQSPFEALIVTRLRAAGAILIGKTNTCELACEPATRGELLGETANPWAPERTPGGSSGGAAAGLAAGMFPLAQGTDAGGSIRIPASCCGVVGIKPTRGLVTFDPVARDPWGGLLHNGPLARSCRDAAAMLDVMAPEASCRAACELPLSPLRVAYSSHLDDGALDPEVRAAFTGAVELLEGLGLEVVEAHPDVSALPELFATIAEVAFGEIGASLSDERLASVGLSVLQLIRRGWRVSAADYCVVLQAAYRESLRIMRFWDSCDMLVTPTVPWVPPLRRAFPSTEDYDAKWREYGVWEAFTSPWNVTGQPAISLPCPGITSDGLPVGVQFVGRWGAEAQLFTLAAAYEAAAGWGERRPPLGAAAAG